MRSQNELLNLMLLKLYKQERVTDLRAPTTSFPSAHSLPAAESRGRPSDVAAGQDKAGAELKEGANLASEGERGCSCHRDWCCCYLGVCQAARPTLRSRKSGSYRAPWRNGGGEVDGGVGCRVRWRGGGGE